MFGHIGQNQPRPAKDMGLVQDGDIIAQGLEAYHGHRVASAGVQGKILNRPPMNFPHRRCPMDLHTLRLVG